MNQLNQAPKPRWGQARRLAFIDLRLQYDGRINRGDLIAYFDISLPQASADLGLYQSQAPQNMTYDASARVYVAQPDFRPIYGSGDASRYLDELHRLERGVLEVDQSFVGFVPPTGVVSTPARAIGASEVSKLVRSIRDCASIRVRYQSMDSPDPSTLVLSPHALGFDGLRWHVRAWCHQRKLFRDFAIGRMIIEDVFQSPDYVSAELDNGWHTHVNVVLVPHPDLSPSQREMVMRDYEMADGKLNLLCRKAMLFYTMRHLNLEGLNVSDNPARQHVIVKNHKEVEKWMREDREGT